MTASLRADASVPVAAADSAAARECGAIAQDLDRLKALIADAGDKLAASFAVLGEHAASVAGDPARRRRVESALATAVTALQFQDMATQLTRHAQQRLAVLQGVLKDAARTDADPLLADTRMQPVRQAGLAAGSIDLF
jgi:HD superfamily phosphodiesterase